MNSATDDLYAVLKVAREADLATIRAAYRRRARNAHPDAGGDADEMAKVNHAYDILSTPDKRLRYDETGSDRKQPPLEDQARGILIALMDQYLEAEDLQLPQNVVARMRDMVREAISKLKHQQVEARRAVERYERRLKRLKMPPLFLEAARTKILSQRHRDAQLNEAIAIQVCALEMLAGFEDLGATQMPPSMVELMGGIQILNAMFR